MANLNAKEWHRKWLECAASGDIESLLPYVKAATQENPGNGDLIKLLIHTAHFLNVMKQKKNEHTSTSVNSAAIYTISLLCCQKINFHLEFDKKKLLPTLYHIIQHFVQKEMIQQALCLRKFVILSSCGSTEHDEECSKNYFAIFQIFYGVAFAMKKTFLSNSCADNYLPLLDLIRDCIEILMCDGIKHLPIIFDCVAKLPNAEITSDEKCMVKLLQLQREILDLSDKLEMSIKKTANNDATVLTHSYLNLFTVTIQNCIKCNNFTQAREVLMKISTITFLLQSASDKHCFSFVQSFLTAILFPITELPGDLSKQLDLSCHTLVFNVTRLYEKLDKTSVKILKVIGDLTIQVFSAIYAQWRVAPASEWNLHITVNVLSPLHRILLEMAMVFGSTEGLPCVLFDGSNCIIKEDIYMEVTTKSKVMSIIQQTIINDTANFQSLLPQAEIAQVTCFESIHNMKAVGCPKWKELWKYTAVASYNIAVHCYNKSIWYHSKNLYSVLCQLHMRLETVDEPSVSELNLWICFRGLVSSYVGLKKFHGGQVALSIALAALPEKRKEIFSKWFSIKCEAQSLEVSRSTMWQVLNDSRSLIKEKYPSIDFVKLNKCEVLIWEFEELLSSKKSLDEPGIEAMIASLVLAIQFNCEPTMQARGLMNLLEFVWRYGSKTCNEETVKISNDIIKSLMLNSCKENVYVKCTLPAIFYWLYSCHLKVKRAKQKCEIDCIAKIPTTVTELVNDEEDNITSTYAGLNLANEEELLQLLDKAVHVCQMSLDAGLVNKHYSTTLSFILDLTAHAYAVHGRNLQAIRTWALVYKLGCISENDFLCLEAASNLLVSLEYSPQESWLASLDNIAVNLAADTNAISCKHLVTFWLSKSYSCLHSRQYLEGKIFLRKAVDMLKNVSVSNNEILESYAKLITSYYLNLPSLLIDHSDLGELSVFDVAVNAYSNFLALYKRRKYEGKCEEYTVTRLLLISTLWLGELCLRQKWAKRCQTFLKAPLEIFQLHFLPTRTAQLLGLLARADLLSWSLDNCQVKVNSLGKLLQMQNNSCILAPVILPNNELKDITNLNLISSPLPVMLHVQNREKSPLASPNLQPQPFKQLEFVSHKKDCECVCCKSLTIRYLGLDMVCIQANLYALRTKLNWASDFFRGAIQLGKHLEEKQNKLLDNLVRDLVVDPKFDKTLKLNNAFKNASFHCNAHVNLLHADFYGGCKKIENAIQVNSKVEKLKNRFAPFAMHLTEDVIEQKVSLILVKHVESNKENKLAVPSKISINNDIPTTPTNKIQKISAELDSSNITDADILKELASSWFNPSVQGLPPKKLFKTPAVQKVLKTSSAHGKCKLISNSETPKSSTKKALPKSLLKVKELSFPSNALSEVENYPVSIKEELVDSVLQTPTERVSVSANCAKTSSKNKKGLLFNSPDDYGYSHKLKTVSRGPGTTTSAAGNSVKQMSHSTNKQVLDGNEETAITKKMKVPRTQAKFKVLDETNHNPNEDKKQIRSQIGKLQQLTEQCCAKVPKSKLLLPTSFSTDSSSRLTRTSRTSVVVAASTLCRENKALAKQKIKIEPCQESEEDLRVNKVTVKSTTKKMMSTVSESNSDKHTRTKKFIPVENQNPVIISSTLPGKEIDITKLQVKLEACTENTPATNSKTTVPRYPRTTKKTAAITSSDLPEKVQPKVKMCKKSEENQFLKTTIPATENTRTLIQTIRKPSVVTNSTMVGDEVESCNEDRISNKQTSKSTKRILASKTSDKSISVECIEDKNQVPVQISTTKAKTTPVDSKVQKIVKKSLELKTAQVVATSCNQTSLTAEVTRQQQALNGKGKRTPSSLLEENFDNLFIDDSYGQKPKTRSKRKQTPKNPFIL